MNYIRKVDDVWHDSDKDMPTRTTDVEFMDKDGNKILGEIVVEMSGFYVYIRYGKKAGWRSFDEMVKWRFIPSKSYPDYELYRKELED